MYYHFKKHMGKQFRFCYDQMFLNIKWLKSRGRLRPTKKLPDEILESFSHLLVGEESKKKEKAKLENFIPATLHYVIELENSSNSLTLSNGGLNVFNRYPINSIRH